MLQVSMHTTPPPRCPVCGQEQFRHVTDEIAEGERLGMLKCASCGLYIVWPRLAHHQAPYHAVTEESFDKKYGPIDRGERLHDRDQNYLEEADLVKRFGGEGARVLDVGCNAGWLLGYLKKPGFAIEGVEPSAMYSRIANRRTGATIHNCYLHEVKDRDGAFDVVTATDVIEHIPPEDIDTFVSSMHRLLKHGGFAIAKTPNVTFTYVKHVLTSPWPNFIRKHLLKGLDIWNSKEHVVQWNQETLSKMFKKHGFAIALICVPKPIETRNSPWIAKWMRKAIYACALLVGGRRHIPWFGQDVCLVARKV